MTLQQRSRPRRSHSVAAMFCGIGGFERGLSSAGHRTSFGCDADPQAISVFAHHFPNVPLSRDVRHTDELCERLPKRSDLLTAGFPCTDFSPAGDTQGFAGGRSSLVRYLFRLLDQRPFEHVLIENVPNWRSLHGGAYMRSVATAFERRGYRWAYRTIDARAFGSPQRRKRIFFYAALEGDPREVLFRGNATPRAESWKPRERAHGFYWTEGNRGLGWGEDCVPTLKGGSAIGIPAPPAILTTDLRLITPDIRDAERLQGFRQGWTALEETIDGERFDLRRRWTLVGNAVHATVSRWIGDNLALRRPYRGHDGVAFARTEAWPRAAYYDGVRRRAVSLSDWPVSRAAPQLEDFLLHAGKPLSERAAAGFLSRLEASSLKHPRELREALRRHAVAQSAAAN